jgi:hypothetical protein
MHYHSEIWIEKNKDIDATIADIMAPYDENNPTKGKKPFWDWFQIGGRWTGEHDGYNPREDIRNLEVCKYCNATGKRTDLGSKPVKCNACEGKRVMVKLKLARYKGDIVPVEKISDKLDCYTLIVRGKPIHRERWNGKDWVKTKFDGNVKKQLKKLKINSGYLVTVDYHD